MLKRLCLIGFAGCLFLLSVSATAPAASPVSAPAEKAPAARAMMNGASDPIEAYLAIKDPSPQDLEKLLAEPAVRNYGATSVTLMMARLIPMRGVDPPASFDPTENVRLFNLLEALVKVPSAPPADNPEEAMAIKLRDKMMSPEDTLGTGLKLMVETFEAAQDPDSARKYYDRFKTLPQKPMLDLSRASAAQSLIRLYCRLGDMSSAVKTYGDYTGLTRSTGVKLRRSQAAVRLVEAFSEAGRMAEAKTFYAEFDMLPQDEYIEKDKVKAGRALIAGYKKTGKLKEAEELEGEIKVEEERLRIADEKRQELFNKLWNKMETDDKP